MTFLLILVIKIEFIETIINFLIYYQNIYLYNGFYFYSNSS